MNELRRMAYLEAMGVQSYLSRGQLPGAAASRRLAIARSTSAGSKAPAQDVPSPQADKPARKSIQLPELEGARDRAKPLEPTVTGPESATLPKVTVPRFSLAAVVAGGWLWIESLEGQALAREQVQLIQAMAQALARITGELGDVPAERDPLGAERSEVAQFDWPIHNNQQLDLGEDAARASVAGFTGRKLEQHGCRGLILLGAECSAWIAPDQLDDVLIGKTLGSATVLADSRLKKQVWSDLSEFAKRL